MVFGRIDEQRSGRFRARHHDPYNRRKPNGKRNEISAPFTFKTKTQARQWLNQQDALIGAGAWRSPEEIEEERIKKLRESVTFVEFASSWLEARDLKVSTRRSYRSLLSTHLLPQWGEWLIKEITTGDIRSWLPHLAPGSPGSRKRAFDLFKTLMFTAEEDEIISKSPVKRNMLKSVAPAKAPRTSKRPYANREPRSLSIDELKAIVHELPEHLKLLTEMTALMGLRIGEVRELRRKDISKSGGRVLVAISRSVTGQGKYLTVDAPKTERSARTIYVPNILADRLWNTVKTKSPEELVFPHPSKPNMWIPLATFNDNLKAATSRAGAKPFSPHDLRRTGTTLALQSGGPLSDTQKMLGHATPLMTMTYQQASDNEKGQAALADLLSTLYEGARRQSED